MYAMAKTAREKMKAKARSLASEKDQKVDSSDWSPSPMLRADVKTGARPIMKPSAKGIGESNAARDTKAAIGKDLKRGAFKSGGAVKDAGVKDKKALGAIDPSPKRGAAQHYKKGGKIKKSDGGILSDIANALAGRGYIDGSTWLPQEAPVTASDSSVPTPPRRPANIRSRPVARPKPRIERENPQLTKEYALQERYPYIDETISGAEVPMQSGRFMKKGGRTGRATGGLINALKGGKKSSKKGGKTDINIVINAGGKTPARHPAAAMPPGPPPMPPDMPPPGIGAGAPAMPPGPPPGAGPMMPPGLPMGRKAGGRISKVASSYKDMTAGAASGEGRLQKTDIAKKHHDAPARKEGGRISKVAKSYKDMTAGAASGEGRLQKTDIAKAKVGRGK